MAALIQIPANDIHVEGLEVDVELPPSWLSKVLGDTEVQPRERRGSLTGRLSRSGLDIVVRGRVDAEVQLPCARCLEPAEVDVSADLSLLLQPASRSELRGKRDAEQEYEFSAAEAELDVYDGETVVLDDFVREAILLEVPNFPLCRDSCPGLASASPDREEVEGMDPRLAPLSAFRKNGGAVSVDDLVEAAAERGRAMGRKPILKAHHRGTGKNGKKKK